MFIQRVFATQLFASLMHPCFIIVLCPNIKRWGHIVFCQFYLSVNFNLCYNFGTLIDRDFIIDMHTGLLLLMKKWCPWLDLCAKIAILDFVATRGIVFVHTARQRRFANFVKQECPWSNKGHYDLDLNKVTFWALRIIYTFMAIGRLSLKSWRLNIIQS